MAAVGRESALPARCVDLFALRCMLRNTVNAWLAVCKRRAIAFALAFRARFVLSERVVLAKAAYNAQQPRLED